MLAPYAPHLAEELWERAGHKRRASSREAWPVFDEALCVDDTKEIVVQVNGKIRERFSRPRAPLRTSWKGPPRLYIRSRNGPKASVLRKS
jgi:leucyl-tRNA synthetase